MHILYIHQYFVTPDEPGGTRSYWISKKLIDEGHKVTMITSSTKFQENIKSININNINVIYIKVLYNQNMGFFRRLLAFLEFMIKSTFVAFQQRNVGLVIATSTPLTVGVPALLLKWFKNIPFIFEVRDLWPEVPIQMGALNNKYVQKLAVFFERTVYKNAKHIVALSPGMQDGVLKFVPKTKVSMIPNMSKIDEFYPRAKSKAYIERLGLNEYTFKIIHFGALGIANGVESIIESAKLLKNDDSVEFIFLGGGATEKNLKKIVENYQLSNVKFLGKFSMKDTSEIVNLCDISIVSFKDLPILYTNSPNKLFDSLSAGKPIIVNSAGWTKELVETHSCGYYVNPNIPKELVEKIKYLQSNQNQLHCMGLNSRWLAENRYDKSILCEKFVDVVHKVMRF